MLACFFRTNRVIRSFARKGTAQVLVSPASTATTNKSAKKRKKDDENDGGPSRRYANTLNLPKMPFPLNVYMTDGRAAERELQVQKLAKFDNLYSWQRERAGAAEFVLHDGPPYANGTPHVGHALNKIVKDILNRWHVMKGDKVHFVPGWDCHGLPIELKAQQTVRSADNSSTCDDDLLAIRRRSREFAQKTIELQREEFRRWGIMADWKDCYCTFSKDYTVNQLAVFAKMHEGGYIYQDYMPVYWSPSSRTALAEAELEYNDSHRSPSLYLRLLMKNLSPPMREISGNSAVHAVIWTTTPWTLPANEAVCYGENFRYALVSHGDARSYYIVCVEKVEELSQVLGESLDICLTVTGAELGGATYQHPVSADRECPFLPGAHVTTDKGTGLVHTAPAHGHDDFKVALKHALARECLVDEDGRYCASAGAQLQGLDVLAHGNQKVLNMVASDTLRVEEYTHSYPYDWRTKKPVLIRASRQWFINTTQLQDKVLECFSSVTVSPKTLHKAMASSISQRPYWCISRQRVWGVPIPVFYEKESGRPIIHKRTVQHVSDIIQEHGTDAWWTLDISQLLPEHVKKEAGLDASKEYVRGNDILDIWFDSGTSWATVLKELGGQADVYLEGIDQLGGWFQSSLLTSVAATGRAPYKHLMVHGFTVDESGKKMSKSLGNVVSPNVVINGGEDKRAEPAYGADVLRWWAASKYSATNAEIGPAALRLYNEQLLLLRKRLRFMLGNLHDFNRDCHAVPTDALLVQDKYMLHLLYCYAQAASKLYENHDFGSVLQELQQFTAVDLSGFYSTIIKDRLYCTPPSGRWRRSAQTVLERCLDVVVRSFAPILPHLAEDVFYNHPQKSFNEDIVSVFKSGWIDVPASWQQDSLARKVEVITQIREAFRGSIGNDNPWEFDIRLFASPRLLSTLRSFQEESHSAFSPLCELLMSSNVSLQNGPLMSSDMAAGKAKVISGSVTLFEGDNGHDVRQHSEDYTLLVEAARLHCCERCRRYTATQSNEPCDRCLGCMATEWAD